MSMTYFRDARLQLADCHVYAEHCDACSFALFWIRITQVLEAGEDGFDPFVNYERLACLLPETGIGTFFDPGPTVDEDVLADEEHLASEDESVVAEAYGRAWRDALFTYLNRMGVSRHDLLERAHERLNGCASHHDTAEHRRPRR